jgi:hypothetical protein
VTNTLAYYETELLIGKKFKRNRSRPFSKKLSGTNTLAYFGPPSLRKKKRLMRLKPGLKA